MLVKVTNPKNGRFIYNGYIGQRVYLDQVTELPDERDQYDEFGKVVKTIKMKVPKWGTVVGESEVPLSARQAPKKEKKSAAITITRDGRASDHAIG